ncbi:MAG: hypothetical protein ACK4UT_07680 [Moraxellaceae bacterium]
MSRPLSPAELQQIREECRALVRKRALVSAGAATVPIPLLDLVVDASLLMQLLPEISTRFGLGVDDIDAMDPEQRAKTWQRIRQRGSQLIGIVLTRAAIRKVFDGMVGRLIARQVTKFVPLGGQLVAAGIGYFVLRRIAYQHIEDCYAVAAGST